MKFNRQNTKQKMNFEQSNQVITESTNSPSIEPDYDSLTSQSAPLLQPWSDPISEDAATDLSSCDKFGVFPNINFAFDNRIATLAETFNETTNRESNEEVQHHCVSLN